MVFKKILLVGWSFYPKVGGVETVMLQHAKFLLSKGIEVAILTANIDGQKNDDNVRGIKVFRRTFINSGEEKSDSEIESGLNDVLKIFRPDLIQFHNGCYPAGSSSMESGSNNVIKMFNIFKSLKVPVLDYAHNAQLKDPEATQRLRNLAWDGIIFVSKYVQCSWEKLGFNSSRRFQIYNGVMVGKFSQSRLSEEIEKIKSPGQRVILFPSRIFKVSTGKYSEQKNFHLVLEACSLLKGRNENFTLVAILDVEKQSETNLANLRDKITRLSLGGFVHFVPSASSEKMPEYYKSSDIICIPSVNEAFSLSYLEGMAARRVVIGSSTGGTVELIQNGKNGILIDPRDSQELSEALDKLISDDKYFDRLSSAGFETAREFNVESKNKELFEVYHQCLSKIN
jgi:glycosyltransferase involved in cell wall biosynthesis